MRHSLTKLFGYENGLPGNIEHSVLTFFLLAGAFLYQPLHTFTHVDAFTYRYSCGSKVQSMYFTCHCFDERSFSSPLNVIHRRGIGSTTLVLLLTYAGVQNGTAFGLILDFTGGLAGSLLCFVLPALIFLRLSPRTHELHIPVICTLCFGLFVIITLPVVTALRAIKNWSSWLVASKYILPNNLCEEEIWLDGRYFLKAPKSLGERWVHRSPRPEKRIIQDLTVNITNLRGCY